MAKEAYYFSHDANARNDPKILSMMLDYGIEGYGMFWIVIEIMREQDGYKITEDKSTYRALAMQMRKGVTEVKKFLTDCIEEYELLELENNFIYSNSLMRRMDIKDKIREKRTKAANKRWNPDAKAMQVHSKSNANAMQDSTGAMQDYAKEKKGKEKKEKETYTEDFEEIYLLYPRSQAKRDTFNSYSKLLKKHSHKELMDCVKVYIKKVKKEETNFPYTSNNFFGQKAYYEDFIGIQPDAKKKIQPIKIIDITYND